MDELLYKNVPNGEFEIWKKVNNGVSYLEYIDRGNVLTGLYPDEPLRGIYMLSSVIFALYNNSNRILILGAACASAAVLLKQLCPNAEIILIDNDSDAQYLAYKYFKVGELKNTRYIVNDAMEFLQQDESKYDFIFVDIFNNAGIPDIFTQTIFFEEIFNHLVSDGILVMNTKMKSIPMIEEVFPCLINPIYGLVESMRKAGFEKIYENKLANSSLLITSKECMGIEQIRTFFMNIIERYQDLHIKATAYGMIFRVEPILPQIYVRTLSSLSSDYAAYIAKIVRKIYRYNTEIGSKNLESKLKETYLYYISKKIKKGLCKNYDDLFDINDPAYFAEINTLTENIDLSIEEFIDVCRYVSTGKNMSYSLEYKNNSFMYFVDGIRNLRNDKGENAWLLFRYIMVNTWKR